MIFYILQVSQTLELGANKTIRTYDLISQLQEELQPVWVLELLHTSQL